MSKVSIIIPLYNKAPYVTKALDSVVAQSFKDYECIIVNDGSTDNSEAVVQSWLSQNSQYAVHFTLYTQENAGVSAARNHGISLSTSEYVCFLDADDWWAPTFLEEMMGLVKEYPEAGIYASNYWYYKPGKTHVAVKKVYSVECTVYEDEGWRGYMNYPKTYCAGEMPIWTGAVMIPRAVLEEVRGKNEEVRTKIDEYFPLGIKLGEDFLLWSRITLQYPVVFLNKPLAYYNNDIPASLRLTRHLHAPETHMLWHLGFIEDRIQNIENGTRNIEDWRPLLDRLRVKGLLDYWLSDEYHDAAAAELKKIVSPLPKVYSQPIVWLRMKSRLMKIGSYCKQNLILLRYGNME